MRAIRLSKATITKIKQNLFWVSFYNILAIPSQLVSFIPTLESSFDSRFLHC